MSSDLTKFTLIGSGLAGGLLAAYLGRRGYDVDLYERRADPREGNIVGGRSINLALSTRGIHALQQLGIADEVLQHAIPMRGRMIHDKSGNLHFAPGPDFEMSGTFGFGDLQRYVGPGFTNKAILYLARGKQLAFPAGKRGIVVELVLFCPFYEDSMWKLSPMNAANNVNGVGNVAAACFAINAVIISIIATVNLPSAVLTAAMGLAGFLGGVIAPSRDMLVRNAAPAGAAGRAFGIVSTGFNFSGILSPLLFGWIMDQNLPHWVFGASVAFMVLTVLLALVTDRKPAEPAKA
jgi:hypothetical protein